MAAQPKRRFWRWIAFFEVVVGVILLIACLWFWWTSLDAVAAVVDSTAALTTDLAAHADRVRETLEINQRVLDGAAKTLHAYRNTVDTAHTSLPRMLESNQKLLNETQNDVDAYSDLVTKMRDITDDALGQSKRLLHEFEGTAAAAKEIASTVETVNTSILPRIGPVLAGADKAMEAYQKAISDMNAGSAKALPTVRKLLEESGTALDAATASVAKGKNAMGTLQAKLPELRKLADDWGDNSNHWGQIAKTISSKLQDFGLPHPGGITDFNPNKWPKFKPFENDSALVELGRTGENLIASGGQIKDVVQTTADQGETIFTSTNEACDAIIRLLGRAKDVVQKLHESDTTVQASLANSLDRTTQELQAARAIVKTIGQVQTQPQKSIAETTGHAIKFLDTARLSAAALQKDMDQAQVVVGTLCDQTTKVLAAGRERIVAMHDAEAQMGTSLDDSLAQTSLVLADAERGLETVNRIDVPHAKQESEQVATTIRLYGAVVTKVRPLISLVAIVGFCISAFMVISGIGLFVGNSGWRH